MMADTVTIDRTGRIVIPKAVRDSLRLEAGDTLALEVEGDRVTLRPSPAGSPLRKERGVWVLQRGGGDVMTQDSTSRVLEDLRSHRAQEILEPEE